MDRYTYIRIQIVFCICFFTGAISIHANIWEFQATYEALFPKDSLWRGQINGGEARLIHWWQPSEVGLALTAGYAQWSLEEQNVSQAARRTPPGS